MGFGSNKDIESNVCVLTSSKGENDGLLKSSVQAQERLFDGFKHEIKEVLKLSIPVSDARGRRLVWHTTSSIQPTSDIICLIHHHHHYHHQFSDLQFKMAFDRFNFFIFILWLLTPSSLSAVTNSLQFIVLTVSLMMSGRLTKEEMDAVSLGNSMINAFGISIGVGLCTACDTLFSQSFGSSDKKQTGVWLQKSIFVINAFSLFVIGVHLNFKPFLIAIGQIPEIARLTGKFVALFSPGLIFQWNYLLFARYLQTQNKIVVPMIAGVIGNIFNVVSQYFLIYVLGNGYEMCAICQAATFAVMLLVELIYILAFKFYVPTWNGWKREAVAGWGQFLSLAVAGIGHVSLEIVCWEIGTFVSGYMGATELAIQAILYQTETIFFMVSFGISISVNIRVGHSLGGNKLLKAKRSLMVGWLGCILWGLVAVLATSIFRNIIPTIFTNHSDVINGAAAILPIIGIFNVIDGFHIVTTGALRGSGRQKIGAVFILLGYYCFGEPIGISLALLTDIGVFGLWIGILIGLCITVVIETPVILSQDWREQARLAHDRLGLTMSTSHSDLTPTSCDERRSLLPKRKTHKRPTVSEPHGCSTDFADMKIEMNISHERFERLLWKKVAIFIAALVFLIICLSINLFLPEELYWPKDINGLNSTQSV